MTEDIDLEAGTIADELWEEMKKNKELEKLPLDARIDKSYKKMIDNWN